MLETDDFLCLGGVLTLTMRISFPVRTVSSTFAAVGSITSTARETRPEGYIHAEPK